MKRIAIDMDEVIADAVAEHLQRYNSEFGEALTPAHLHGKWLSEYVHPSRVAVVDGYLHAGDFFAALPVMPHAIRVVERLQQRYEVFIATAAMEVPNSFRPKYDWLKQHFPFIRPSHIVFCGDKSILHADYLIDDSARQLALFQGEGILFSSPRNVNVTGYRRVKDWLEVEAMFLS